jgi:dual-specificity kinase
VLQTLRQADSENRNRCIQLIDAFDWRGHICIVTPLLGLSVFDFLKSGGFVPFPGSHIQAFARQLLGSIAFLHDLNLVHTDLKPENILLINHTYQTFTYNRNIPSSSTLTARSAKFRRVLLAPQINLIDFGSATFDDEYHSSVVSTRHYRAPEIILGIGECLCINTHELTLIDLRLEPPDRPLVTRLYLGRVLDRRCFVPDARLRRASR